MEVVVREIEQHQCLRALCLEGNTVGVDAARAIAKALEKKDLLQVPPSLYSLIINLSLTAGPWFDKTVSVTCHRFST